MAYFSEKKNNIGFFNLKEVLNVKLFFVSVFLIFIMQKILFHF